MSLTRREKVHGIIHGAAASAAGVGAGLAQLPMADHIPISAIQISMISAIALVHGRTVSEAGATSLLGTFTATMGGRAVSQFLVGMDTRRWECNQRVYGCGDNGSHRLGGGRLLRKAWTGAVLSSSL